MLLTSALSPPASPAPTPPPRPPLPRPPQHDNHNQPQDPVPVHNTVKHSIIGLSSSRSVNTEVLGAAEDSTQCQPAPAAPTIPTDQPQKLYLHELIYHYLRFIILFTRQTIAADDLLIYATIKFLYQHHKHPQTKPVSNPLSTIMALQIGCEDSSDLIPNKRIACGP